MYNDCMRNRLNVQKWSRPAHLKEDFAAGPGFHRREHGTAEWLQVTKSAKETRYFALFCPCDGRDPHCAPSVDQFHH